MARRRVFPVPWFYAVIRMDPVAMVKDLGLDDVETLEAVEAFNPKKYLVYVNLALDLPMPNSKWCRYCVKLIGNTLRTEDRTLGLLADMVIPIFPNTQCASDTRPPIHPTPDFPFPNCFHWMETITNVRMRRPASGFTDDSRAIRLEPEEHHATRWTFTQDYDRIDQLLRGKMATDLPVDDIPTPAVPLWALRDPVVRSACCAFDPSWLLEDVNDSERASTPALDQDSSSNPSQLTCASSLPSYESGDEKNHGTGGGEGDEKLEDPAALTVASDIFAFNIFGWDPDPTFPLVPLVDLWCELDEHLTAETVPNPLDWYEEEKRIAAIIMDAFARREHIMRDPPQTSDHTKADTRASERPSITDSSPSQGDELVDTASLKEDGDTYALPLDDVLEGGEPDIRRTTRRWSSLATRGMRTLRVGIRSMFRNTYRALSLSCSSPRAHDQETRSS